MKAPIAKKVAKQISFHDEEWIDNYFWLRDKQNPEVLAHLEAENAYTKTVLKSTEELQESLFKEMKARIKEEDMSAPVRKDDYYYYSRTEKDKQYAIHCRKKIHPDSEANEEILLDENALAEGQAYFQLGNFALSPDHQLLAFATDTEGNEVYTLYIKDLRTGKLLDTPIGNTYYSLEWLNDNKTFFYTTLDDTMRAYRLYRHVIDTPAEQDELVYEEQDEMFTVEVDKSKTEDFIFLNLSSAITTEVYYLDANHAGATFQLFQPRAKGVEYSLDHHKNGFYILTNEDAKNYKLMATSVDKPEKANWQEVIGHNPEVKLESLDIYNQFLAVYERSNGLRKVRVMNLTVNETKYIEFPEAVYMLYEGYNPDYSSTVLRYSYTSLIRPVTTYDYDMNTSISVVVKETQIVGGYDASKYETERLFALATDGTTIPISIVYKKGVKKDGNNPLYLYGYGSYGITMDTTFSSNRISLLERGFVYAIAHIRGGGDMGEEWHDNGKFLQKKNTFTDFITCAEYLIAKGYTNPSKLAISGGSAGGLLVGAVVNLRPDLFKAVVAKVPFVDVMNTMLDPTLPLTIGEYEEWGDPNDPEYFNYMLSYSPYDNVEAKAYPNILATAGLNDPRVSYWEPAKWVAKLRELKTDDNHTLLFTHMGAGHSGSSGRFDYLKDVAIEYAFIMKVMQLI